MDDAATTSTTDGPGADPDLYPGYPEYPESPETWRAISAELRAADAFRCERCGHVPIADEKYMAGNYMPRRALQDRAGIPEGLGMGFLYILCWPCSKIPGIDGEIGREAEAMLAGMDAAGPDGGGG